MPNTPVYGLPYPDLSEPPNGPEQIQALAEAVESTIQATDTRVTAVETTLDQFSTGGALTDVELNSGTTTSATYTATITGGTPCIVTFTAPQSGIVLVCNNSQLTNSSSTQTSLTSWELREGSTPGSGAIVVSASDDRALRHVGSTDFQAGDSTLVTGLTAGATYHVRQMFRGSGGTTATFSRKRVIVLPQFI